LNQRSLSNEGNSLERNSKVDKLVGGERYKPTSAVPILTHVKHYTLFLRVGCKKGLRSLNKEFDFNSELDFEFEFDVEHDPEFDYGFEFGVCV
jgi:hypothetical protein